MFKGKTTRIIITGRAREKFEKLNAVVENEIKKGVKKSRSQLLLRAIKQKIEILRRNPEYGIHIPKDRIPKKYVKLYDVNNLWKINSVGSWRMIYTIRGSKVEIISLIIDLFNHKEYSKEFKYKRN